MITKTLRFILTILALVIISGINAQTIITIGTGTTTNSTSSYPAPYGNYYWGAKHQFIIPASELIAAGGLAGNINSLAFDVATVKGVALSGFTIKIGTTTQSALSGTFISGLSQVYSVTSYTETAGWNTHNFSSPFSWDGTSNLIIETCFNNSSWTDNAIIRNTPTTYISTIAYNNDDQSVCSFTSGSTYYVRPNIKLGISPPVSNDLGISSWESPKDGCSLSSSEHITIKVKNYGTSSQNNYTLKYSIDGGTTWTSQALTTSISPGNTLTHTFTTTANFSAIGQYTCLANVVLAGDPNSWNDTFGPIIITNNNSNPLPYNEDFESFTDGQLTNLPNGWTISPVSVPYWLPKNASGGYNYSPPAYDHTKKGEAGGMFLNFNDYYGTSGDSSFFTSPCLDLAGGSSPKIRFWYTSYGFDTQNLILQENINGIWFGVSWNNSGRYNNYSSNTWTEAFASLSSNAQKIRFKAIKSSSDNSLGIDDITIYQAFNNDLMVSEWIEPINGSSLGTGKDIKIEIYNYGLSTQSNIPVYYTINGGTTIVGPEIIPGPLSPNAALQYTFTNKANLTTSGIYKGGAVVALATDQNKSNDTLMQDFIACGGLSGTYTIKPNGTGDFKNFTDAIEFLDYCGVSGPVVFNVDPGTYTEQLTFEYYTGISATNNILFQSTSPDSTQTVITYNINDNNNNYIIHFNNAKHITFKGFNIMPDQNSSYNTCIRFYQADSNAVIGNQIVTNINNNPIITTYTYSNSNYNKIIGNFIYGGSNSIELYATSSSYREYGNIIEGNTITNFNQNAIKCYYQDHIQIKENFINTGESQNMLYGIYIYKSEFPSITKNKIFIESTYSNYGIYLSTCSGGSGDTAQIVNNFISLNSGTGSSNYGIYLSSSNFYHIYNNSSHIYGNQPLSSSFYDYSSGQVYVLNNNFANTAGGKAYYTNYSTNIPVTNYNNLYSSGIYIGYWGSNITNLSAWKTATNRSPNSISVHPGFNSNNDLHTTAISLNGSGTPIPTVTDDIDGDTRNIITPDIGADEFSPSSNDLAITEIIAPISGTAPSSSVQVIIQVVNKGLSGQGNFPVKYSINGGSTYITQTIYQTIMPGDTLNHTFTTTANMSTFGNYPIIALVDLTTDQNRSNDTIAKDIFACNAMSGTYQIGGTSSDFASFSQAVNALMSCGVSGAVTINIAPGTYNEQVNIDNISGTYASNTVTFKSLNDDSSSVILQYAPIESNKNFVVQFNHCHHISFKQITIKNLSSSYGHVVVFTDSAYLNSIENNHLEGLVTTSSSDDFAIIYNPKNSTEHMQTIKNNRIMNGSFGISLYGISDGYSPIDEISNIIEGNKIMNFNYAGIEISNQDSPHAISNYIESGTSGSEIGGIILEYSNYAQRIQKNHIIINGTSNKAGIILNYCAGDGSGGQIVAGNPSTDYGLISNNFICIPTVNNLTSYGIVAFDGNTKQYIYNNSINDYSSALGKPAVGLLFGYGYDNKILNNILSMPGGGLPMGITDNYSITSLDNNCFFTTGSTIVSSNNQNYSTLAAYKASSQYDANSISVDPNFVSGIDLHTNKVELDSAGVYLSDVLDDFDGETRDTTYPDIGADEFIITVIITSHPQDANIPLGDTATFMVQATGQGSLSYQWQKNNINISGETNSILTISNVGFSDTAWYSCIVSDTVGFEVSNSAWLNILTLDSGLIAYYPFTGNINDSSGHAYNGTNYGAILTSDRFWNTNSAISFNGTSNYIKIPDNNDFKNIKTISLWFNNIVDGTDTYSKYMVSKGTDYYPSLSYWPWGHEVRFWENVTGASIELRTDSNTTYLEKGTWHHTVVVLDGVSAKLYVDGALIDMDTLTYNPFNNTNELKIGGGVTNRYFTGTIDDIRIYDRPLYSSEIQQLYGGYQPPMRGYYTIGTSGGEDYPTFNAAVNDLVSRGIDSACVFEASTGTYSEQVTIPSIIGASSSNTITFQSYSGDSTDVTLTYAPTNADTNWTWNFSGAEHVIVKHIKIKSTGATYSKVINLCNNTDSITIANCIIEGANNSGTGDHNACIEGGKNPTYSQVYNINIENNLISGGSKGIRIEAYYTYGATNTKITNNIFRDFRVQAIGLWGTTGIVSKNDIEVSASYPGSGDIIQLHNPDSLLFINNSLRCYKSISSFIECQAPGTAANRPLTIANNFISMIGSGYAIELENSGYYNVFNNSINGNILFGYFVNSITLRNNILKQISIQNTATAVINSDFNCFYDNLSSLSYMQTLGHDSNSVFGNPGFISNTDLHATGGAPNNAGTPLAGITTDIDGEVRNVTTPDIGADEYTPLPMKGYYTIGTAGTEDYPTFNAAVTDLAGCGIDSACVFEATTGIYNEQIEIPEIIGASSTNTITFQSYSGDSTDAVLTHIASTSSTDNYTLKLNNADFITFKNLTIKRTGTTQYYGNVIVLADSANNNKFINCQIIGYNYASALYTTSRNLVYNYTDANCNNNEFHNNYMQYGAHAFYYYGSSTSNLEIGTKIINNILDDQYYKAIEVMYQDGIEISNNEITHISNYYSTYEGPIIVELRVCRNGFKFTNNKIIKPNNYFDKGLAVYDCAGTSSNRALVANNFISTNYNSGTNVCYGIWNGLSNYIDYYNNTVNIGGDTIKTGSHAFTLYSGANLNFVNNIFANNIKGQAFYTQTTDPSNNASYNCLYTNGGYIGTWGGIKTDLAALQTASGQFANSISVNPVFADTNDLHTFDIRLNGMGTPLTQVSTDIDGESRNASTPDIGADEFAPNYMRGYYTIGAMGTEDYPSFTAAVNDLVARGIDSACVFEATTGTYNEQFIIPEIIGASAANTITFQSYSGDSTDVILSYTMSNYANSYIIDIDGADYLNISNITLKASGTTYADAIRLKNDANHININNCIIEGDMNNGVGYGVKIESQQVFSELSIKNNMFRGGLAGITIYGNDSLSHNLEISNNLFIDHKSNGIFVSKADSIIIRNNIIKPSDSSISGNGIYLSQCDSGFSIQQNQIIANPTNYYNGINVSDITSAPTSQNIIANNYVSITSGTIASSGMRIANSTDIDIIYNSILLKNGITDCKGIYFLGTLSNMKVLNNNIANLSGGYAYLSYDQNDISQVDYNNLYTTGQYIGYYGNSSRATLADMQSASNKNLNSISVNPAFENDSSFHAFNSLLNGAATPIAGLTTDIEGEARNASTPDIGCDEFLPSYMKGYYTIGTAGTEDYASFNAAVFDLSTRGIDSACVFEATTGTYNEQISIPAITGSSTSNTITFQSYSGDSTDVILTFDADSAANNYVIELDGTGYITIKSLTLKSVDTLYCNAIRFNGSNTNVNILNNIVEAAVINIDNYSSHIDQTAIVCAYTNSDSLTINNNVILNGSYGFRWQDLSSTPKKLSFNNNFIKGFSAWGLGVLDNQNTTAIVDRNTFEVNSIKYPYGGGVQFYHTGEFTFSNNTIYATSWGKSLSISNSSNQNSIVYNNFIADSTVTAGIEGINLNSCQHLKIYNNSVNLNSYSLYAENNCDSIEIYNNIFEKAGTGWIFRVFNNCTNFKLEYNNLRNNGGDFVQLYDSSYTDITSYKTTGNGLHSISINPQFVSNANLHAKAFDLYRAGKNVGITTDIDGESRFVTAPCIGADEFTPPANDAGILSITTSDACEGQQIVTAEIRNFGINTLTSATINCKINNISQTPFNWTGSLASSDTIFVVIDTTLITNSSQSYDYMCFTTNPNGFTDGNNLNDTFLINNQTYYTLPTVSFTGLYSTYCESDPIVILSGSPTGGTFSGVGVTGSSFTPSTAVGNSTVIYEYQDGNACFNSDTQSVTVYFNPTVSLASFSDVCVSEAAFTLSGGSPANGTYTGSGVAAGIFTPTNAGVGTHTITYKYSDLNGCIDSAQQTITVNALPNVTLASFTDVCVSEAAFTLSGGSPVNGTYTGNGVAAGIFTPTIAGVGTHTITYKYSDINGCVDSAQTTITVNALPNVTLTAFSNVCVSEPSFNLIGHSPLGGTYSGNGIIDSTFTPSNAGVGTHIITYKYSDINACVDSAQQTITVNSLPIVTLATLDSVCVSEPIVFLTGGLPTGGTYTGIGVNTSGELIPSIAGIGVHTITYKYSDVNGCIDSAQQSITVNPLPIVTLNPFSDICISEPTFTLSGGSPIGGTYYGTGISAGSFNPINAGAGTHTLSYIYSDINGCSDTAYQTIVVNSLPNVTLSAFADVCGSELPFTISGGSPVGGTYTGNGIVGGVFNPSTAGVGIHTITYKYSDINGCLDSAQQNITVNALPTVTHTLFSDVCVSAPSFTLSGGFPIGGTYTGNGVSNGNFEAFIAGVGTHTITYIYSDTNSCVDSVQKTITVNALPTVTLSSFADVCESLSPFTLTGGSPIGGTYSGNGITNGIFNPAIAGVGTHTITYAYSDINSCTDTAQKTITVNAVPIVSAGSNYSIPYGTYTTLSGSVSGSGLYSYSWSPSDSLLNANVLNPTSIPLHATTMFKLVVTDNVTGCKDSSNITITVTGGPLLANPGSNPDTICTGSSSQLSTLGSGGSGIYSYIWTSIPTGFSSTLSSPIVSPSVTTKYYVTISDGFNQSNDSVSVVVNNLPNVSLGTFSDVCVNASPVLLTGGIPTGGTYSGLGVTGGSFYPSIAGVGVHSITYSYTDGNSCINTATQTILAKALPTSTFSVNSQICSGDTATINYTGTATSGGTYNWNFDGGIIITGSGQGPYEVSWATNGIKTISLTVSENSCNSLVHTQNVIVNTNYAIATAVGNTTICDGDSVILFANTGSNLTYQWLKNDTIITGATNSFYTVKVSGNYSVLVTNNSICVSKSNIVPIIVTPVQNATFTVPTAACTFDTVTVTYTGTASASAIYQWNFDGGIIVSGSGQGPYEIYWTNSGIRNLSLQVMENSCISAIYTSSINLNSTNAIITPIGATTFCDGDSVGLYANTGANLIHQWYKNGVPISGETQPFYIASTSGNYTVLVTNTISACVAVSNVIVVTVNSTNFNLDFTAAPNSFTTPPFIVSFSNLTPNSSNYYFYWDLGDGNNSTFMQPFHTYQFDGTYTVTLIAENIQTGCRDTLTKPNYIICTGGSPNPCTVVAQITPSGSAIICPNDSLLLSATSGTGWTYQWSYNGVNIAGANSSTYYAKQTGAYRIIVTDTVCSVTSNPFILGNHQSATPVISSIDSIRPCTNDSMELYLNSFYNSYLWSTGEFTSSIFVKYSGNYTVTCTDINGCALGSAPFVVNASLLQAPEICIIGVDSANHNRIIWEKPTSVLIDSFSVYRETTVANVYSKIGTLPYSAPGIFTDLNSNPAIRAYRYKLTATDTCGSETDMSNFHKTMHLTINKGLPGTFNLIWDGYKGFPFGSYAIYRGIDSTNLSLITQIQSSLWSYTDINPPSDTVYYQIEVIKAFGCYPDSIFSKANTNYNSSRSNVANTIAVITPDTTGISTASIGKLHVNMYPNPTNGKFQIDISDLDSKTLDMCIVNMEGQIMYCEKLTNVSSGKLTKHLDFSTYPKGIYFIRIITDNIVKTKKVIIE